MSTASSLPLFGRALARLLLVAAVVGVALAAAGLLQPRSTTAADPIWACYSNSNHSLRSVPGPSSCAGNETAVRLDDSDNPIWICLHPQPGHIRYAGPADDDPITGNCWGAGSTQYFQLPGDNAVTLCVHNTTKNLRFGPCAGNETPLVIPARNRAPVAQNQNVSVDEDDDVLITLGATDPDGDPLTFAIVDDPDHGDLSGFNASTGEVTYTPDSDYSGPDSFTFTANDGSLDSNVATVSITVNPVNDNPTDIALSNDSVDENEPAGTLVGTFTTTDPDTGDTHTYTLVAGTGDDDNADFQIVGDQLQTAHGLNFEGDPERSIRVQTDDGNGGTFEEVFTIHVLNVNEAPTAIAIDDTEIGENRPAGTAVGILSTTDPDTGDTFTYTFATGAGDDDNASFQLDGDRLESAEVFDFEVKSSYTVRIRSTDAGGLFTEEQFTITVVDLNDDPTDIALSNTTIDENIAANSVVGTFTTTDQDTGDTHTYTLVSGTGDDDNGAFNILGSDLRITNSPDFETQDSYSIRVQTDDGNGGTFQKVFTITVTDLNEAPTAGTDNYDAIGNTQLRINTPTSPASSVAFTSSGTNPLANDTDPDTNPAFNALQITAAGTCTKGGTLTLNAADQTDGRLTYLPPQGIESANAADTDDCTYTLSDGTNNVSGTVKVLITDLVWYVDNAAAAGGDGRSTAVYNSLAPLTTGGAADALDNANDYIFVFQGNANYTGGLVLETSQRLFGQPHGLTVGATTLIAGGGSNPILTNSGGAGITLANGVEVQRVNVTNTSAAGVTGTGVTSATIGGNTSITNTGGNGFNLAGAAGGTINVGSDISNTGGKQVSIQDRTSGTVTLSGAISGTGTGILLNNNASTTNITGDLNLSTGTSAAFTATNASLQGTLSVDPVGTNTNVLSTTTGTALTITNTTISANGVEFQSISSNGAANGIVLNNTGTVAGLSVLGTGTTDASGGVIQSTTGDGVILISTRFTSLKNLVIGDQTATTSQNVGGGNNIGGNGIVMTNADDVVLDNVKIARTATHGIDGTGVTNVTIANSEILNAGDGNEENGLDFSDVSANNLDGIVSITNTIIDATSEDGIFVENFSGIVDMTLSGVTIGRNQTLSAGGANPFGENGVLVRADGSAVANLTVNGTSSLPGVDGNGIFFVSEGSAATASTLNVTSTTITDANALGIVVFAGTGDETSTIRSRLNFTIGGSVSITNTTSTALSIQPNGKSVVRGTVTGTTVNGSTIGRGIEVLSDDVSDAVVFVTGNTVSNTAFNGIFASNADVGRLDIHITGNNVSAPVDTTPASGLVIHGIEVNPVAEPSTTCLDIEDNQSAGNAASGGAGYRTRQRGTATFQLEELTGDPASAANIAAFLQAQNISGTGSATVATSYTAVADGACRGLNAGDIQP